MRFWSTLVGGIALSFGLAAQPVSLPSTTEFMNILTVCGAGSSFKFEGDVRRDAPSIYEKGRTEGKAVQDILAAIFTQLPESERAGALRDYLGCVRAILPSAK